MARFAVKSRFFDVVRKRYVDPGAAWAPANAAQAERLQKAGCIVPEGAQGRTSGSDPSKPKNPPKPATGSQGAKDEAAKAAAAKLRAEVEAQPAKALREALEGAGVKVPQDAKKADLVELVLQQAAKEPPAAPAAGGPPADG